LTENISDHTAQGCGCDEKIMFLYVQAHLQAILLFQSTYSQNLKLRVIRVFLSHTNLMMWTHYILQHQKDSKLKFQIAFGYETMSQI
jgi:hypothetical protein